MFGIRRLRWFMGLNQRNMSTKRLPSVEQRGPARANLLSMMDAVHEVAIYIHRFHNLDLFEQGWYKIKVTLRWEDGDDSYPGIPARVVQYEAPEVGYDNLCTVWKIDDADNSFSTPPFRIKYARQDVVLSIMISFYLSFAGHEAKSSAVIMKFELMQALTSDIGAEMQAFPDAYSASVHEYRIPPKALLGLHSYCPVHFDVSHAVLVDTSVHVSLQKASYHTSRLKVPSDYGSSEGAHEENSIKSNKAKLIKALMAAHDILLEDLRRLSEGINQAIDLTGMDPTIDRTKFANSSPLVHLDVTDSRFSQQLSTSSEGSAESLSWDDLLNSYQSLGNQLLQLWNTFLKFHRENKTMILEFLRHSWAIDRRSEWSIWMVHSISEMPHQSLSSRVEGTIMRWGTHGRSLNPRKLTDDPSQTATMRAELHRRGIAQMKINNRSLQDMYIFEDPLRIPIIIIERMANMDHSPSVNSYFNPLEAKANLILENGSRGTNKSGSSPQRNGQVLRVVVFVHGFQGHHLDLRLVRNQWLLIDPKIQFLMSEANEDKTSGDFREMGLRLAEEVVSFVKRKMDKFSRSGHLKDIKLSFVGHSIGNLIIRTALAESIMEPYLRYLYTYVSISGPHLGYMYSSNSVFNSGLWLLKKLKDIQCIHQLTFTDDPDLENTFIYNLSKKKTLVNFRNIILLSSPQDGYVPYHSARIEHCPSASLDYSKKGKVFHEMLNNCLHQINALTDHGVVMRCDINFNTSSYGKNLNTLIGRAAHIEFLESDIFAKFIMWSFPELFT
ncbi:protein FAM135B isoform X1 [Neltuma alba]|uniref:protein FAM135B isoform X1 n=1 Tax=Neltuma alba TaxID=207710 RepID=UPI0010A34614|nr:protein FAM135B-like isoform X1 [Prosopis alba]